MRSCQDWISRLEHVGIENLCDYEEMCCKCRDAGFIQEIQVKVINFASGS